jgi:hypothetical protein
MIQCHFDFGVDFSCATKAIASSDMTRHRLFEFASCQPFLKEALGPNPPLPAQTSSC